MRTLDPLSKKNSRRLLLCEILTSAVLQAAPNKRFQPEVRSRLVKPRFVKVERDGTLDFQTNAVTTPNISHWHQRIKLIQFQDWLRKNVKRENLSKKEIADALYKSIKQGDVKVLCDDPSFLYFGYKFIAWQIAYGIKPENRPPIRNNPEHAGTICKHLYAVMTVLPKFIGPISHDVFNQLPFLRSQYK